MRGFKHWSFSKTPGGTRPTISLGKELPPGPWNPDLVYDKKFVKILKNWYTVYDFQVKFHSFFRQNAWFLDPVYKNFSEIFEFETLFMRGRSKNHTLKGGTSPYSLCMGVSPRSKTHALQNCNYIKFRSFTLKTDFVYYLCYPFVLFRSQKHLRYCDVMHWMMMLGFNYASSKVLQMRFPNSISFCYIGSHSTHTICSFNLVTHWLEIECQENRVVVVLVY